MGIGSALIFVVTYIAGVEFWTWVLNKHEEREEIEWHRRKRERNKEIDKKYNVDWEHIFNGIGGGVGACTLQEYEERLAKKKEG